MPRLGSLSSRSLTGNGIGFSFPKFSGLAIGIVQGSNGGSRSLATQVSTGDLSTFVNSTDPGVNSSWQYLASSGAVTMAISDFGKVATTTDGVTWTMKTDLPAFNPTTLNVYWSGLAYGNGTWVAIVGGVNAASTQIAYSTDNGASWTSSNALTSARWGVIKYSNGYFVALAYTTNYSAYSSDGISWTAGNTLSVPVSTNGYNPPLVSTGTDWTYYAINAANSIQVAYSNNHAINWTGTLRSLNGATTMPLLACYGNGKMVMVQTANSSSWTSINGGFDWTQSSSAFAADTTATYFISVNFVKGYFVACSRNVGSPYQTAAVWISQDGLNWSKSTVGSNNILLVIGQ